MIDQSRGLYTQHAKKSRRPRIIRPQLQAQPQPYLQNNINGNLMNTNNHVSVMKNGNNGNLNMVSNYGMSNGNLNVMNNNGNRMNTNENVRMMNSNSHHGDFNMMTNGNINTMNNNGMNNGNQMNMNRNLNNNMQGNANPYPQREGNFAINNNYRK